MAAIFQADVLLHGLDLVQITHLQLMDNQIGGPGCLALGEALMLGGNTSLMTLRLDHNAGMGTEGVIQLSKGLRTNHKLSVSCLSYPAQCCHGSIRVWACYSRCTCRFVASMKLGASRWRNCWRFLRPG